MPSLRNVALTGPWWHDGSARTLNAAIARHGMAYAPGDMGALVAFLNALSDSAPDAIASAHSLRQVALAGAPVGSTSPQPCWLGFGRDNIAAANAAWSGQSVAMARWA